MNAFEIVGLACFDEEFRRLLFEAPQRIIDTHPDLTAAERDGLLNLTGHARPLAKTHGGGAPPLPNPDREGTQAAMKKVGDSLAGCPRRDCPWPKAYLATGIPD